MELPNLPKASIRYFLAVPTAAQLPGWHIIRLPRCATCYDEVHDYKNGIAHCVPIEGLYRAMELEQRERWDAAERFDSETKPLTREQP
jgi:hypothetical protein